MNKLILAISLVIAGQLEAEPFKDNQVKVNEGILQGTLEPSGIRVFKGVPFAQPPVGKLRWQAPQPPKDWKGVRQASEFGPRPMAGNPAFDTTTRAAQMSEDCLYLNIWTPAKTTKEHLPVLVWFYGGGFQNGDASEVRYDGESMGQRGVIMVTVNYRLNIFGFMAHPELTKESPDHASGNYGLLDQNAALKWVHKNIAAFGGDPKRVTIAGQSAGSLSVCAQMASPLSRGLFSQAIGESGSVMGTMTPVTLSEAEQTGVKFASNAGYKTLADMRAVPADELFRTAKNARGVRFNLVVDGYFFPELPARIFARGKQAKVPLLAGWNSQEGQAKGILANGELTTANYEEAVKKLYPNDWQDILKCYAPAGFSAEDVASVASALASDRFIGYSTWKWGDIHSQTARQPVYRYCFAWARPPLKKDLNAASSPAGAPRSRLSIHSSEIEYAWGNVDLIEAWAATDEDRQVSKFTEGYFANFIKTGNPNGPDLPNWPTITPNQPAQFMRLDVSPGAEVEQHRDRYLLLDRLAGLKNPVN